MLTLYLKPGCPYCENTIKIVETKKIQHKKIILDTEEKRDEIKKKHNYNTFPQVFFKDKFIGGNNDFTSIINMCEQLNMLLSEVNDDVLNIVLDLCCELSSDKKNCKIKKLLTQKKITVTKQQKTHKTKK